jgi:hypothetical protein
MGDPNASAVADTRTIRPCVDFFPRDLVRSVPSTKAPGK